MPVLVDEMPLDTVSLNLRTVGEVLAHVQRDGRMAVELRWDGTPPDLTIPQAVHARDIGAHQLEVTTADPRELALDAMAAMEQALGEADSARVSATDLLARNEAPAAMAKLASCLTTWHQAQQCILQSARLLRIDLNTIDVDGEPLHAMLEQFSQQLRQIKDALRNQDYVTMSDILTYELDRAGARWRSAMTSLSCAVAQQ